MKTSKAIKSHYFQVFVIQTGEQEVFSSITECRAWIEKVKHTFQDEMKFEITEVMEKSIQL